MPFPAPGSALGNPTNAERLSIAYAISIFGELSERERGIVIETSRLFSGRIFDLEDSVQQLTATVLELRRLMDAG